MTDLLGILPSFPVASFAGLLATVERHALSTADLLMLHPADVAKQTLAPLLDVRRLVAVIRASLADDLVAERPLVAAETDDAVDEKELEDREIEYIKADERKAEDKKTEATADGHDQLGHANCRRPIRSRPPAPCSVISTLDDRLDTVLGGGLPVGCITEITGESGAGKTQLLLALCLAVQLGSRKHAVYISTEAALSTPRLAQMLAANLVIRHWRRGGSDEQARPQKQQQQSEEAGDGHDGDDHLPPSLDRIHSTVTPDLESQEHILAYQVPVLLARHRVGLLVIDSIAANFRAEFERSSHEGASHRAANMAARGADLVRLGALLRDLARRHQLAVVVANQVADRFALPPEPPLSGPAPSGSALSGSGPYGASPVPPALRLDHQQRWFTGWGDDPHAPDPLKTPSLGLVWSSQIACRVALLKRPVHSGGQCTWRRWLKLVFAPHAPVSGMGLRGAVEFELTAAGLRAVPDGRPVSNSP